MGAFRNPSKQSNQDFTATMVDMGDDTREESGEPEAADSDEELRNLEAQARDMQVSFMIDREVWGRELRVSNMTICWSLQMKNIQDSRTRLDAHQQQRAAAAQDLAKNYSLKLDGTYLIDCRLED